MRLPLCGQGECETLNHHEYLRLIGRLVRVFQFEFIGRLEVLNTGSLRGSSGFLNSSSLGDSFGFLNSSSIIMSFLSEMRFQDAFEQPHWGFLASVWDLTRLTLN